MIKCGLGFDAHRFEEGRLLIIGGVKIDYHMGLLGHSDADVLVHAVIDAIIGALGKGDIGKHFPDTDNKYKNIDSLILLNQVFKLMDSEGFVINNIDATIVAQEPKLSPYTQMMSEAISKVLNCEPSKINIKAKTTEGMGFEGRKEGISAQCICTLIIKQY